MHRSPSRSSLTPFNGEMDAWAKSVYSGGIHLRHKEYLINLLLLMISRFCLDINGVIVFATECNELILESTLVYNKVKSPQCNELILRLKIQQYNKRRRELPGNNKARGGASFLIRLRMVS